MTNVLAHRFEADRLMLIAADRISEWIGKGELTARYFNPGELFREVHLLLLNDDRPDIQAVQKLVGDAKAFLYNYLPASELYEFGRHWRPGRIDRWARGAYHFAQEVRPSLIRCHGANINAYMANAFKRAFNIPYVVSMHINPELDVRSRLTHANNWRDTLKQRLNVAIQRKIERRGLSGADCVVCVYRFIENYARNFGARRVEVIYNVVNPTNLLPKSDYSLAQPPRIIVPGRQFSEKDPTPVIQALTDLPNVRCTLVGDGQYHEKLKDLASRLGVSDRCEFYQAMPNDELCRMLKDFDILVSVNNYGGVSKVELEAAHVGMPVITNSHPLELEPEVLGRNAVVVSGDQRSYQQGLQQLLSDEALRRRLGTQLRQSVAHLSSERMESSYVSLYRELISND